MSKKLHELTPFGQRKFNLGPISSVFAGLISLIVIPVSVICLLLVVIALFTCGAVRGCSSVSPQYVGPPVSSASSSNQQPDRSWQAWACSVVKKDLNSPEPGLRKIAMENWKSYGCDELEGKN